MNSYSTRALDALLDSLHQMRDHRSVDDFRSFRVGLIWRSLAELRAIPPLQIGLDDSMMGHRIRDLLGRPRGALVWAMQLPDNFDHFVASHERANNLRKSMRKAAREGISCGTVESESRRDAVLSTVHSDWSLPRHWEGGDQVNPDYHRVSSDWRLGTVLVAQDRQDLPLAAGIMLQSGSTALLGHLAVGRSHAHRSVIRYAINAFAVKVAIENGASTLMLNGGYLGTRPGVRTLAINTGYRPRRLVIAPGPAELWSKTAGDRFPR